MTAASTATSKEVVGDRRTSPLNRDGLAATACFVAVLLSCLAWSLLTPPFQAPDEPIHFAYVQKLAETGQPPSASDESRRAFSNAQDNAMNAVRFSLVRGQPTVKPPWTKAEQETVDRLLDMGADRANGGGPEAAANYPALYYLPATLPYLAARELGATTLGQLAAVRTISCLFTALAALFTFLFVRELFGGSRLPAAVGALGVGLLPQVGFIGSSVNNDSLVLALSAALFWLVARSFRRGLTVWEAAGLALLIFAGWQTKPIFLGLVPGALAGGAILLVGLGRRDLKKAASALGAFVGSALLLVASYLLMTRVVWANGFQQARPGALVREQSTTSKPWKVSGLFSYAVQYWVARFPGLQDQVPEPLPVWETMAKGFIGRFGWLEYQFPPWVFRAVLYVWVALLALAGRFFWFGRRALGSRIAELAVYAAMVVGCVALLSIVGYQQRLVAIPFEQGRYLFPLVALYGALLAAAVRGAGRVAGPYVGVAIVVGTAALNMGGMLLTISRFYA